MTRRTSEQEREIKRELALVRLHNPLFLGLAATKAGNWQEYGKVLEAIKMNTLLGYGDRMLRRDEEGNLIDPNGDRQAYLELILPALEKDQGRVDEAYDYVVNSLNDIKVEDYVALLGTERRAKESIRNKYASQLPKEKREEMRDRFLQILTDRMGASALGTRVNMNVGKLEEVLCEAPEPEAE